jgi:CHAT domain-containing protein
MGSLLEARGEYARAEAFFREALAMVRSLYPRAQFPDGHPLLARILNRLGFLQQARGDYSQATEATAESLAMCQDLAEAFAYTEAEAEALNYRAFLPGVRDTFLSVTARLPAAAPADHYRLLWQGKAALARVLEGRQRLLHAATDPGVRKQAEELLDIRQRLARLVLGPAGGNGNGRTKALEELNERKEALEKGLARALPELARRLAPPADLARALPAGAAFVDLFRYRGWDPKARRWDGGRYAAFVLRGGRPVRRVELGPAAPIEEALASWRRDIDRNLNSAAGERLRRLVWEPLAGHLPAGNDAVVYLSPDGELSALPWAALPGSKRGGVLLEDHAVALVPHGPFLLEQINRPAQAGGPGGVLLALGGVRYDRDPEPLKRPPGWVAVRPADRGGKAGPWVDLPGSAAEVERVVGLARRRRPAPAVLQRRGTAAGTAQLLRDLPKARWAHLATHGFFAAPASDARRHLFDEGDFLRGVRGERRGAAARNPLTQSGLVLAGANRPPKDPDGDGGILTAEALAGLDLGGLDLAVLSACETGLGEAASGEGVFGLQRAFHLAGTRNVVASLWRVDDRATAALMALFYHHLWAEGRPPLQALRQAQLALYRHPERIPVLARGRLPDFDKEVPGVAPPPPAERPKGPAPVKHWAAFVLSGCGR